MVLLLYVVEFPRDGIMFSWLRREPNQLVERRKALSVALVNYPLFEALHRQGPNFLRRRQDQTEEEHLNYIDEFIALLSRPAMPLVKPDIVRFVSNKQ